MGRSSRSTEARGGSEASSLMRLSKVSGSDFRGWEDPDEGPFWIVLALLGRLDPGEAEDTDSISGREKDRVERSGLGRALDLAGRLEAMRPLLKLASMVVSLRHATCTHVGQPMRGGYR